MRRKQNIEKKKIRRRTIAHINHDPTHKVRSGMQISQDSKPRTLQDKVQALRVYDCWG